MEIVCDNCGAKSKVSEWGATYPGAKEREYAYCPKCREELYSEVLPGSVFKVELIEEQLITFKTSFEVFF